MEKRGTGQGCFADMAVLGRGGPWKATAATVLTDCPNPSIHDSR
jgi:hypothetical protein